MIFSFPNLQPEEVVVEEHPEGSDPQQVGFLPKAEPITADNIEERKWIALTDTAFEGGWRPEMPNRGGLYFPSPEGDAAYQTFIEYLNERRCSGFLSAETGLPTFLFGELDRDRPGANDENAALYLQRFELIWGGRTDGIHLTRVRRTLWDDLTFQVVFHQTNAQGWPVYGAQIICTYDGNEHLSLVTSSLFPSRGDELPVFPDNAWQRFVAFAESGKLEGVLTNDIPSHIGFKKVLPPTQGKIPLLVEFWILPIAFTQEAADIVENVKHSSEMWSYEHYHWQLNEAKEGRSPDPERATFHAAYRIPFLDQYGHCWAAWIDAESLTTILKVDNLESHASRNYEVFPSTVDAIAGAPVMKTLNLGLGATTLRMSPKVRMDGVRLFDPLDTTPPNPPGGGNDIRRLLGANAYHHVWWTQNRFSSLISTVLRTDDALIVNGRYGNPVNQVAVFLDDESGEPSFNRQTGEIHFRTGDAVGLGVLEPAKDGEVIAHEYTHAVLHYYFPELLEHEIVDAWKATGRGLDEALAYYFACFPVENPSWGEFAYPATVWGDSRDLSVAPAVFAASAFSGDPAGGYYGYAIWWARILWELSQETAISGSFNRILLKALRSLARRTPVVDPAAAGNLVEEIRGAFNQFATAIFVAADTPASQSAIRALFSGIGLPLLS